MRVPDAENGGVVDNKKATVFTVLARGGGELRSKSATATARTCPTRPPTTTFATRFAAVADTPPRTIVVIRREERA